MSLEVGDLIWIPWSEPSQPWRHARVLEVAPDGSAKAWWVHYEYKYVGYEPIAFNVGRYRTDADMANESLMV